jgi:hypothetical protein
MRYMLMIYGNHKAWDALTQAEIDDIGRTHKSLQHELADSGELVDHKELAVDGAKIVRTDRGACVVSDGPFSEGQQILGGYYLVECTNLDRATQIAARFRESAFAPIEVRRLSGETSWDTGGPGDTKAV